MSQAMLRGLAALEAVGQRPRTLSDLSRDLGIDKATLSRLISAGELQGWFVRVDSQIRLGPRGAALGSESVARQFEGHAREMAHATAGSTGFDVVVGQFAHGKVHMLASAEGRNRHIASVVPDIETHPFPVLDTAIGRVLVAMRPDDEMQGLPRPGWLTEEELLARVARIRAEGVEIERGDFDPSTACIAVPWAHPACDVSTAMAVVGRSDLILSHADSIRRTLEAAVSIGATPEHVLAAAAALV
ncbi:hypothetical protein BH09ACT10_BH09ACT10_23980 [soil metagenome]